MLCSQNLWKVAQPREANSQENSIWFIQQFSQRFSQQWQNTSRFIIFNYLNYNSTNSVTCHCNIQYYPFLLSQKRKKKTCINSRPRTCSKISDFTCRMMQQEEEKKGAEPSTWLANFTHTCAPTCRHFAHECRRERQSAFLLLHSSYIHYCRVTHIYMRHGYTAAAWRLSFLNVVRGGVWEEIS